MGSGISLPRKKGGSLSMEKRIKYLNETPFIQFLTEETVIREFAKCFPSTLRTAPGKDISLDSQTVYVVCEGEVDLSTYYPHEKSKIDAKGYLCRKRRGDIVNVGQTEQDVQRRMSTKSHMLKELAEDMMIVGSGSTSPILLLCGNMDALDKFSKAHPELSKPIVEICTTQIEDRLLTIPFLREIPKSKLNVFSAMCRYEAFDAGQTVFEEGSDADKLFLVLNGVAQVVAKSETTVSQNAPSKSSRAISEQSVALKRSLECTGNNTLVAGTGMSHVTIAELKSGDYFGETALVFNIDRTCGVKTSEKSLFLTVHRTDFENFLKICPIENTLRGVIKQRMVSKLSSLGIPFLDGIPDEMLSSLATSVEIKEVPERDVIFRQGDVGDQFYIIVHGGVKVDTTAVPDAENEANNKGSADGEKCNDEGDNSCNGAASAEPTSKENSLGSLGPGQYFGEMSLVNGGSHLRTATVTSTQKSILLSIDKDSFQTLFGSNNNILAEFEIRVLKHSVTMKHVLAHSLGIVSFREFLESEHAGENIDFWVAVTDFQADEEHDSNKRKEQAKHIFVTFCANYADRQVNLPHTMLADIDKSLHGDKKIKPDLFDKPKQEIFRLLEKDKFLRYKQSASFAEFLGRLGILSIH